MLCLILIVGYAVVQCAASASSSVAKHRCKEQRNRVVSQGLQLPLEVFKTSNGRGWGVRCSFEIPIGTFVCDYVGRLLTDSEAVRIFSQRSSSTDPQGETIIAHGRQSLPMGLIQIC